MNKESLKKENIEKAVGGKDENLGKAHVVEVMRCKKCKELFSYFAENPPICKWCGFDNRQDR